MIIQILHGIKSRLMSAGKATSAPATLFYGQAIPLTLALYHDDGLATAYTQAELDAYATWEFGLDSDFDHTTPSAVSIVDSAYTVADNAISFVAVTYTERFLALLGTGSTASATAELRGYVAGQTLPGLIIQFTVQLHNTVLPPSATPPEESLVDYVSNAQLQAVLAAGCDVQYSLDSITWADTVGELSGDPLYVRYRTRTGTNPVWWDPIPLLAGQSLTPDAEGTLAERDAYDAEDPGFVFGVPACASLYIKLASGWSDEYPLAQVPGADGVIYTPVVSAAGVISWTNDGGLANPAAVSIKGADGADGVVWTPALSTAGVLSWTNDSGLANPADVNIQGANGARFTPSFSGTVLSWSNDQSLPNPPDVDLVGPAGEKGDGVVISQAGPLTELHVYDDADRSFTYLDTTNNHLYHKLSDTFGDWADPTPGGVQGIQGEQGIQGIQGELGENAAVVADHEFVADDIVGGSLVISGVVPIAQIELYDASGYGQVVNPADESTPIAIQTEYANDRTLIYFGQTPTPYGGRVRFAQGISGQTLYQMWLDDGHTGTQADMVEWMRSQHSRLEFVEADLVSAVLAISGTDTAAAVIDETGAHWPIQEGMVVYDDTADTTALDITAILTDRAISTITGTWAVAFAGGTGEQGEPGDPGDPGADGTVAFADLTPSQLAQLAASVGALGTLEVSAITLVSPSGRRWQITGSDDDDGMPSITEVI